MITCQQKLNNAGASLDVAIALGNLRDENGSGFGDLIASLFVPSFRERTGLTAAVSHVEELPGMILGVLDEAGAVNLTIIYAGIAVAGQVLVVYDADGIATLTFGDGANTGYRVLKIEGPRGVAASLATVSFY